MPEKTAVALSEFLAPLMAFAGAVLMLLFKREMEVRRMLLAVLSGPLFAAFLTPSVVAWLLRQFSWLPSDWSVVGGVGCLVGMLSINIIAVVAHLGRQAESVAPTVVYPEKGGRDAG